MPDHPITREAALIAIDQLRSAIAHLGDMIHQDNIDSDELRRRWALGNIIAAKQIIDQYPTILSWEKAQ
jgi:hypothetical protein